MLTRLSTVSCTALIVLFTLGCGGGTEEQKPAEPAKPAGPYEAAIHKQIEILGKYVEHLKPVTLEALAKLSNDEQQQLARDMNEKLKPLREEIVVQYKVEPGPNEDKAALDEQYKKQLNDARWEVIEITTPLEQNFPMVSGKFNAQFP